MNFLEQQFHQNQAIHQKQPILLDEHPCPEQCLELLNAKGEEDVKALMEAYPELGDGEWIESNCAGNSACKKPTQLAGGGWGWLKKAATAVVQVFDTRSPRTKAVQDRTNSDGTAKSCHGRTCYIEDQFCPKGRPGAGSHQGYCCVGAVDGTVHGTSESPGRWQACHDGWCPCDYNHPAHPNKLSYEGDAKGRD